MIAQKEQVGLNKSGSEALSHSRSPWRRDKGMRWDARTSSVDDDRRQSFTFFENPIWYSDSARESCQSLLWRFCKNIVPMDALSSSSIVIFSCRFCAIHLQNCSFLLVFLPLDERWCRSSPFLYCLLGIVGISAAACSMSGIGGDAPATVLQGRRQEEEKEAVSTTAYHHTILDNNVDAADALLSAFFNYSERSGISTNSRQHGKAAIDAGCARRQFLVTDSSRWLASGRYMYLSFLDAGTALCAALKELKSPPTITMHLNVHSNPIYNCR